MKWPGWKGKVKINVNNKINSISLIDWLVIGIASMCTFRLYVSVVKCMWKYNLPCSFILFINVYVLQIWNAVQNNATQVIIMPCCVSKYVWCDNPSLFPDMTVTNFLLLNTVFTILPNIEQTDWYRLWSTVTSSAQVWQKRIYMAFRGCGDYSNGTQQQERM